ncbi:hypothetical protein GGS26DRAFT_594909 [Hypomontagnella submonticulosa]|nr:hypothetical protein GGS26DRAFT_594909 [Hypomontagnella submonticulosa]
MDPLSISVACIALGELMFKVSRAASSFVGDFRSAQADVDAINSEFDSIKATIGILTDEFLQRTPDQLRDKILAIVGNCATIVNDIDEVLSRYQPPLGNKRFQWAISGKKELEKLKTNLNTHRHALDIALDTVKLVIISDVRDDTIEIRRILEDDIVQIKDKIERIDQHLSNDGRNERLQRWLDDISCYAESIVASTSTGLDTAELRRQYGINPEPRSASPSSQTSYFSGSSIMNPPSEALPRTGTDSNKKVPGKSRLKGILKKPARNITTTEYTPRPEEIFPAPLSHYSTSTFFSPATSQVSLQGPKKRMLRRVFGSSRRDDPGGIPAQNASVASLALTRNSLEMYRSYESSRRQKRSADLQGLRSKRSRSSSVASYASDVSTNSTLSYYRSSRSERRDEFGRRKQGLLSKIIEKIFL